MMNGSMGDWYAGMGSGYWLFCAVIVVIVIVVIAAAVVMYRAE